MTEDKETASGFRLKKLANGNVQLYAKRRSKNLAAIGIKASAWRLVIELRTEMIAALYSFSNEEPAA